jgi:hypothetical protein
MTKKTKAMDRQALEHLLDVCGADRTRWPARERLRFASFIAADDEAKRLVAESAALDALLDRAPRASEDREIALKERIVAAALRSSETRLAVVTSRDAPAEPGLPTWLHYAKRMVVPARTQRRHEWSAAAVLAASLVVGVMLGSTGTFDATMQEVAEATGISASAETSQLALGEDILAAADEDLL